MTLPQLPFWSRLTLEVDQRRAELDLGRSLEPYHLLLLGRYMTPYGAGLAIREANRRAGAS